MRIAFEVLAFARPRVTVATLVLLFGFHALGDGVFSLLTAIGGRRHREDPGASRASSNLGRSLLSVLFALMLMVLPAVGALALVRVIAGYALILGVFEVMLGVDLQGVRTA